MHDAGMAAENNKNEISKKKDTLHHMQYFSHGILPLSSLVFLKYINNQYNTTKAALQENAVPVLKKGLTNINECINVLIS